MMTIEAAVRHLNDGEWEKAHVIVQHDESILGCWAHGVVHILEGDLDNARYWYRRAERSFPDPVDSATEIAALAGALEKSRP